MFEQLLTFNAAQLVLRFFVLVLALTLAVFWRKQSGLTPGLVWLLSGVFVAQALCDLADYFWVMQDHWWPLVLMFHVGYLSMCLSLVFSLRKHNLVAVESEKAIEQVEHVMDMTTQFETVPPSRLRDPVTETRQHDALFREMQCELSKLHQTICVMKSKHEENA